MYHEILNGQLEDITAASHRISRAVRGIANERKRLEDIVAYLGYLTTTRDEIPLELARTESTNEDDQCGGDFLLVA